MERVGLDNSIYYSKFFKDRQEEFISANKRDALLEKARNYNWDFSKFSLSEIHSLDLLNRLTDLTNGLVRGVDGELYLIKGFSVDLTSCRRLVILKVLYSDIIVSIHEDLFVKELSDEEKYKSDNTYEFEVIYKI